MSNPPASLPFLLMQRGPEPNRSFALGKSVITIGRRPDNDIVVDDAEVSRYHARLTWGGQGWILEDLASHNGTFVNGQRLTGPVVLTPGTQVGFGSRVLFSMEAGLPETTAAPALPLAPPEPLPRPGGRLRWYYVILPLAMVVLVVELAVLLFLRQQARARIEFDPPHVLVTEPAAGLAVPAGGYLSVAATAFGRSPIQRAEFWVDGEMKETQDSLQPGGMSPLYASFNLLVSEGPHLLFVRAVNTLEVVGQSMPVSVVGGPAVGGDQALSLVTVGPGQKLADIAQSYGTDTATLQKLNPNLGGQEPAADSTLVVLIPPDKQAPVASQPSAAGGSSVPGSGSPPGGGAPPGSNPVPIPDTPMLQPAGPPPLGGGLILATVFGVLTLAPVSAPTDLQAQVTNCKVRLSWKDNATNESRYDVWMAGLGSSPRIITSLSPAASGAAWFEFAAPQPGFFSFWVEAANFYSHQPSNIAWVWIDPKCPTTLATNLQLDVLDMSVSGNRDRAYCYVSVEKAPEARFPQDANTFIPVAGGQGNMAALAASSQKLAIPIPPDGSLDLSGECWGWAGKSLDKLGSFSNKFTQDTWDGTRKVLDGKGFQIGIALKSLGALTTTADLNAYTYNDPTLAVPYDVLEAGFRSPSGNTDPLDRELSWKWDGDPKKITGFKVYLNGVPYNLGWLVDAGLTVGANERTASVRLPAACGKHFSWQVSAFAGEAESNLSAPYGYDQPKCQAYVVVKFVSLELEWTGGGPGSCDTLEAYYFIRVNNTTKSFFGWPAKWDPIGTQYFFKNVTCGSVTFDKLGYPYDPKPQGGYLPGFKNIPTGPRDTIIVPITTPDVFVNVVTFFKAHQTVGADRVFGAHNVQQSWPSVDAALAGLGCGKLFAAGPSEYSGGKTLLYYSITVYPNKCKETEPYLPGP